MIYRPIKKEYVAEYRKSCISKDNEVDDTYHIDQGLMKVLGLHSTHHRGSNRRSRAKSVEPVAGDEKPKGNLRRSTSHCKLENWHDVYQLGTTTF